MNEAILAAVKMGDRVVVASRSREYTAVVTKDTKLTFTIENGLRFSRKDGLAFQYSFTPDRFVRLA